MKNKQTKQSKNKQQQAKKASTAIRDLPVRGIVILIISCIYVHSLFSLNKVCDKSNKRIFCTWNPRLFVISVPLE